MLFVDLAACVVFRHVNQSVTRSKLVITRHIKSSSVVTCIVTELYLYSLNSLVTVMLVVAQSLYSKLVQYSGDM